MLSNARLLASLDMLEYYFGKVTNPPAPPAKPEPGQPSQFCKYAALELCGWIEEAQDHIAGLFAASLKTVECKSRLTELIEKNYGFDMYQNFMPMMAFVIGMERYDLLISDLRSPGSPFYILESTIQSNQYKKLRNTHAHTHFNEAEVKKLTHLNSPAVVKKHAECIYKGFDVLVSELKIRNLL
ncbi:hypothetical protein GCM10027046_02780 [Uliginosibacterium flavum]|uniref:Uncharacterized protein n=1 Tax=Uliginosibacterium flavum TaxID=1396831 RepID=A0ABV2TIW8_9RHOO